MKKPKRISVSFVEGDWKNILIELGESSRYTGKIRKQLPKKPLVAKKLTKAERLREKEKSPLTKIAEAYRIKQVQTRGLYEKIAERAVKEMKVQYTIQRIFFYENSFYLGDIYLPEYKILLELDGSHHYTPEGMVADETRTNNLLKLGVNKVVRIPNSRCTTEYIKGQLLEAINSIPTYEVEETGV